MRPLFGGGTFGVEVLASARATVARLAIRSDHGMATPQHQVDHPLGVDGAKA